MQLCVSDRLTTMEPRKTADGYLVTEAKIARTGMYDYAGFEFGRPDKSVLKIYRPEETVFSDASMAAFAHKPVTNDHPIEDVGPTNYSKLAKGFTGGEVRRDGEFLVVPLMLTDAATIEAVEGGKLGLSAGYKVEVDMTPGVTDSGEAYDGKMVGVIQGNHVAVVDRPRAGTFIGDSFPTVQPKEVPLVETKTITHDGIPLIVTDAAEAVINKQSAEIAALKIDLAAKDSELGAKDAKIGELQGAQVTQAMIDAAADEKADVVGKARALVGDKLGDTAGKTPAEIRKTAVGIKLGDTAVAGKSDDYIGGTFDHLCAAGNGAAAAALAGSAPTALVDAETKAHARMIERLKGKAA